jgi:hypothetical protein
VHTALFWNKHQKKRLENLIFFKSSRPNIPENILVQSELLKYFDTEYKRDINIDTIIKHLNYYCMHVMLRVIDQIAFYYFNLFNKSWNSLPMS